jgi:hypothetical protein
MNINVPSIDHASLIRLAEADSIIETHVVGQGGGWSVLVRYGNQSRVLAAQRGNAARVFKKMDTLVSYLKDVGISKFDVDSADFDADAGVARSRPDRAQALREMHEAAAHDAWFRGQVQLALDEADGDDAQWVAHDVATQSWAEKRTALANKANR